MILKIRSEETEHVLVYSGQKIWFSPNLSVQRISIEEGHIVIQVDSSFETKREESKEDIAIIVYGEELSSIQEPPYLTKLLDRVFGKAANRQ